MLFYDRMRVQGMRARGRRLRPRRFDCFVVVSPLIEPPPAESRDARTDTMPIASLLR